MTTQFVISKNRRDAKRRMAWAAVIVKVDGGYMGFASRADYQTWMNQK